MSRLKGKLIVGQSGGCTHVINASLVGVIQTAGQYKSITGVWGARHGIEGVLNRDLIYLDCERTDTLRRMGRCPAAALGSCRTKIGKADAEEIVRFCRRNGIRYFIYIGGNDSADTLHRTALASAEVGYAMRLISVPKTIDNDLPHTDHSPGFGSAARVLASVVADTGMETEAMSTVEPVKIVEVMGRNAGWLTCAASLSKRSEADAPQFVWPPEIPFNAKKFLRLVRSWLRRLGYCVLVVAETVRDARGTPIAARGRRFDRDAFGHPRITGAGEYLCALVREKIGVRARWDKPGTIQRMSSAHFSETDLREARHCGRNAVRFAAAGRTDAMVVMRRTATRRYKVEYDTVPLAKVANTEKTLPPAYFDQKAMLPTTAFGRYALPIVGAVLPEHPRLKAKKVTTLK